MQGTQSIAVIQNGFVLISGSQNIIQPKGGGMNIHPYHISANKEGWKDCTGGGVFQITIRKKTHK